MEQNRALLEHCIKCSACQVVCPVYRHEDHFPGPKHAGPDLVRLLKSGADTAVEAPALDWCSGCMRCELACPHGVPVTTLIREARAALTDKKQLSLNTWRDLFLGYPNLWGRLGTTCSRLVNGFLSSGLGKLLLNFLGLAPGSSLPQYAQHQLTVPASRTVQWTRFSAADQQTGEADQQRVQLLSLQEPGNLPLLQGRKVAYFPGCYANFNEPEIGETLITLLELLGFEVAVPRTACCGIPLLAGGFQERAHRLFERNIQELLPYVNDGYTVACTCPTCGLALKKIYLEELKTKEAERLAAAACDYTEILEPLTEELTAQIRPVSVTPDQPRSRHLVYHQPCHALGQGIGDLGPSLLQKLLGVEIKIIEGCCGQSGTYGFKKEKSRTAAAIARPLLDQITALTPDLIITPCGSCQHKIATATGFPTHHPLSLVTSLAYLPLEP